MLVSAKEMLNKARDGKYAVGQFNINNLEWTKAILLTATLAHGVRGCASGLRYVLYMYMTSLEDPTKVIAEPGGYLLVHPKQNIREVKPRCM